MADRRLQVFHTVARLLSFTKAAETLHMTQPAVTFQVRQLEEYFNTRLFDRTHNRISLTEAGARVFQFSDKIFELYGEMENAVREMTGEISGSLTIGASTTIAEYMLPALLGDFRAKYPDVSIHLKVSNTDGIVSMVENNTIDLGVVEAPVSNKNLVVDECRRDNLVAIVPPGHPKADLKKITLDELLEYPFICREEGSGTREVIAEHMAQCVQKPDVYERGDGAGQSRGGQGCRGGRHGYLSGVQCDHPEGAASGYPGCDRTRSAAGTSVLLRPSEAEVPGACDGGIARFCACLLRGASRRSDSRSDMPAMLPPKMTAAAPSSSTCSSCFGSFRNRIRTVCSAMPSFCFERGDSAG